MDIEIDPSKLFSQDFLTKMKEALKTIDDTYLKKFQEPAILHLYLILRGYQNHSDSLICNALDCLNDLLQRIEISKQKQFMELFNQITCIINPPSFDSVKGSPAKSPSEELKFSSITCLKSLIMHSSESVLTDIYKAEFIPALGFAVWGLLRIIEFDKLQKLRIITLDCLILLVQVDQKRSDDFMMTVGNIFASFLPGILSSLSRTLLIKEMPPQKVAEAIITNWAKISAVVLNDVQLDIIQMNPDTLLQNDNIDTRLPQVKRSSSWVKTTMNNVSLYIKAFVKLVGNINVKIRQALLEWADILLHHCSCTLNNDVSNILNMVITLATDDFPDVSCNSQRILQKYSECLNKNSIVLEDILLQNVILMTKSLRHELINADDEEKLVLIKRLKGYLKILGSKIENFFNTSNNLQLLCDDLLYLLEMDYSKIMIVQDTSIENRNTDLLEEPISYLPKWPLKNFMHFHDIKILQEVQQVCYLLGFYGNLEVITDHLLPNITKQNHHIILFINEIIEGAKSQSNQPDNNSTEHLASLITLVLSEYLKHSHWYSLISSEMPEIESGIINLQIVKNSKFQEHQLTKQHVLFACLALEGIGKFAMVLGKKFEDLLFQVLYKVLENLASDYFVISYTAYQTLQAIAKACDFSSLQQLVLSNVDYLIHGISLRLRHYPLNPKAPLLLKVMLEHCSVEILPFIENTVYELLDILDIHYHEKALVFMQVLLSLVKAIHRWFPSQKKLVTSNEKKEICKEESPSVIKTPITAGEIRDFFIEYHRLKQIAEGNVEDNADIKEIEDANIDYDEKRETPGHIKLVIEVLTRCSHLLSCADSRVKFTILSAIQESTLALEDWQDDLLPMVHKIWPPFVHRFQNEDCIVTLKAFDTLCTFGQICGNFIYKRTVKDVWPHIIPYLEKQSRISYKSSEKYKYSPQFKLQYGLLCGFGILCSKLEVSETELDIVATACLPYLSIYQPLHLQEAALITFEALIRFDSDAVWLKLKDIYSDKLTLCPPDQSFVCIKLAGFENCEFAQNVKKLLEVLES